MPAKGTGGKHLEPKIKKKKKVYPERTGTRTGPGTVKSIAKSKKKEKLIFTDGTKKNVPGTPIVPREAKPENLGEKGFKLTFKDALNAAKKGGREKFTYKGKLYFTPTGAANNRDKMKTRIAPKGVFKKKSSLDADTRKSYEKRVAWMKKRKAAGKNFSAKNLAELEAKLK